MLWRTQHWLDYTDYQTDEEKIYNDKMWEIYEEYSARINPKSSSQFEAGVEYIDNLCRMYWDRYVEP